MRDGGAVSTSKVAIVECRSYQPEEVERALGKALDLLGGADAFVRPGERIVLKPNFLVASPPEKAVTTHPEVFRAVARALKRAGAELSFGDSPGFGSVTGVAKKSGVAEAAEAEGLTMLDFSEGRTVPFPDGNLVKQFDIASPVLDADGLVTLPKMKTHGLTRVTGAVKNQLGCVPGLKKGQWHACMPDPVHFAQMLVDLNRLLKPRLAVMDAVVAMEGNGPRGGDPREVGALIVSADMVAVDTTACRLMDLDPALVLTNVFGAEWGLGSMTDIEYVGDQLERFVVPDFDVERGKAKEPSGSGAFARTFKNLTAAKPKIVPERCTACGTCVEVCPLKPSAVRWTDSAAKEAKRPPEYDYDACIRCYCCQEMCPEGAIEKHTPFLGAF